LAGAVCSKVYTGGGAYILCPDKPTVPTSPGTSRPYPNESCGEFFRGTWAHVLEVATGAGTTPSAILDACGKGYTADAMNPFTVEQAIERLGAAQ
jgi:hypothetical protein